MYSALNLHAGWEHVMINGLLCKLVAWHILTVQDVVGPFLLQFAMNANWETAGKEQTSWSKGQNFVFTHLF